MARWRHHPFRHSGAPQANPESRSVEVHALSSDGHPALGLGFGAVNDCADRG
jgi:hypothetical protein